VRRCRNDDAGADGFGNLGAVKRTYWSNAPDVETRSADRFPARRSPTRFWRSGVETACRNLFDDRQVVAFHPVPQPLRRKLGPNTGSRETGSANGILDDRYAKKRSRSARQGTFAEVSPSRVHSTKSSLRRRGCRKPSAPQRVNGMTPHIGPGGDGGRHRVTVLGRIDPIAIGGEDYRRAQPHSKSTTRHQLSLRFTKTVAILMALIAVRNSTADTGGDRRRVRERRIFPPAILGLRGALLHSDRICGLADKCRKHLVMCGVAVSWLCEIRPPYFRDRSPDHDVIGAAAAAESGRNPCPGGSPASRASKWG